MKISGARLFQEVDSVGSAFSVILSSYQSFML